MSSRPAKLPRWGVDGSGDLASNIVEPASGSKDTGFLANAKAISSYFNWLFSTTYLWIQYFSDGVVSFVDVQTATLETTGNVAIGGALGVTGATTIGGALSAGAATLASAAVAGSATVGGTLGVTSDASVGGNLSATGNATVGGNLSATGTASAGDYKVTAPQSKVIAGPAFQPGNNGWSTSAPYFDGDVWRFNLPPNDTIYADVGLRAGDRILSITWHFNKVGNAGAMTMTLQSRNGTTDTTRDSLSDSSSGAGQISVTRSGISYTIASGDGMRLSVQSGATVQTFSHAVVTWDHP